MWAWNVSAHTLELYVENIKRIIEFKEYFLRKIDVRKLVS